MESLTLKRKFFTSLAFFIALFCFLSVTAFAVSPHDPQPSQEAIERHEAAEKQKASALRGAKGPALRAGANGEYTYTETYFPEEYSSGYINLSESSGDHAVGCGTTTCWWGDPSYCNTNTSKNGNIYIDYYGGACMRGQMLDVRTYVWGGGCSSYWMVATCSGSPDWGGYLSLDNDEDLSGDRHITREFHFYTAGHCGDPAYEVTFKGVFCICDLDGDPDPDRTREYMRFDTGLVNAWLNSDTTVEKRNSNTWWGTDATSEEWDSSKVWVTLIGTPSSPIKMTYGGTDGAYAAGIDYVGCRTTYVIVDTAEGHPPVSRSSWVSGAAKYGIYSMDPAENVARWQFMGWYTNSSLTSPAQSRYSPLTSDITFYGYYQRSLFAVATSVTNGSITPTDNNVSRGANKVISYSPSSGYLLNSVTVDGASVNIASYPDSYTFGNVTADHSIAVTYSRPTAGKTWAKT